MREAVGPSGEVAAGAAFADAVFVRSERLLMEEIDYSILHRWFVGLNLDQNIRDHIAIETQENIERDMPPDEARSSGFV
jgi:hypothetical protein